MDNFLTLLPPMIAVLLVVWRKDVSVALVGALLTSEILNNIIQGNPTYLLLGSTQTLDRIVAVFNDASNTRIILFSLMMGALMALMRYSGGVLASIQFIINNGLVKNKRQAGLLSYFIGLFVFVESNLSMLTAGIISRGLFDKFGLSRAKLAYIIDSTCSPVCILFCLNAWGAYILGLLSNYQFEISSLEILITAIAFNFYPILTLLVVLYTIVTGKDHGPMKQVVIPIEENELIVQPSAVKPHAAWMFFAPIIILILGMILVMLITGSGNIIEGSGSHAVFYATAFALLVLVSLMLFNGFKQTEIIKKSYEGFAELLPLVIILVLSIALGLSLKDLGTGSYIASLVSAYLPLFLIPALLFVLGGLIAFTTGTSWGTFAILVPMGMPIAMDLALPPYLLLAAILGGGIFGDHCSPLSDSTLMASVASGCELLDHVKTQLPYALVVGGVTIVLYLIAGLLL